MAAKHQVSCINKHNHGDPHERIKNIGGVTDGKRWIVAEDKAIEGIKSGEWAFFVNVGGKQVDVVIASHNGRQYLKTFPDGYAPNNLLSLPECP
jgi:hypothetical protein